MNGCKIPNKYRESILWGGGCLGLYQVHPPSDITDPFWLMFSLARMDKEYFTGWNALHSQSFIWVSAAIQLGSVLMAHWTMEFKLYCTN